MTNPENKAVANRSEAAVAFSVVAVAGLSVAAIVYNAHTGSQNGPKVMDESARALFQAQGYDVVKRQSYKKFEDTETTQGETATYVLKKAETGAKATGTLSCGMPVLPDMVMPRMCHVKSIVPK